MDYRKLLNQAIAVHQQLLRNMESDPEVIDLELSRCADELHKVFYTAAPWFWFHRYVKEVHDALARPYWLCGRPGVNEFLNEVAQKNQAFQPFVVTS
jgi:hypothetical protein